MSPKHFLTGLELPPGDIRHLIDLAETLKAERSLGVVRRDLSGKSLALLFEKPSLRTHLSFSIGMQELGGNTVESFSFNRKKEEPEDVGRVIAGYCHAIVLRTHSHDILEKMAAKTKVPVINGLSDSHHPCQILADILTLRQVFANLHGLKLAYIGDGNNILHSLMLMAPVFGIHLAYACPKGYEPHAFIAKKARGVALEYGGSVTACSSPKAAVKGALGVYTDVWTSMGFEAEEKQREASFQGYQLNADLFSHAAAGAVVMHCLPMNRGQEITDDMAEHANSVLFRQSENRLHVQKALLLTLLNSEKNGTMAA